MYKLCMENLCSIDFQFYFWWEENIMHSIELYYCLNWYENRVASFIENLVKVIEINQFYVWFIEIRRKFSKWKEKIKKEKKFPKEKFWLTFCILFCFLIDSLLDIKYILKYIHRNFSKSIITYHNFFNFLLKYLFFSLQVSFLSIQKIS